MSDITIVFTLIGVMVALFISNRVPVAVVALGMALSLYFTGILTLEQSLRGFGDTTVLFIASLFVVSAGLDAAGVTTWVGQLLIRNAGKSRIRLQTLTMLLVGILTAFIGVTGAVSALLPVVILAAVRLRRSPSQLLIPLAFAAQGSSMLVLTGSLVNVLISDAAIDIGIPAFGYFEMSAVGVTLLAGTIAIIVATSKVLLPERIGRMLPDDLSRHPGTLADQYKLYEGLTQVEVTARSSYTGTLKDRFNLDGWPGLSLVAIQACDAAGPLQRDAIGVGDLILLRGDPNIVSEFAREKQLLYRDDGTADVRGTLFNKTSGFAEVVVPPRSALVSQSVFPGMITPKGDLVILAIQRRGKDFDPGEVTLAAGDTLVLQGSWQALDDLQHDPDVLVVDSPELMRRQSGPMGLGSKRALTVLAGMVLLLSTGAVPTVVAGLLAACAMVLLRVLKIEQAYRALNGTALIMIASLIPLSTAMYQTGAAALIADRLVEIAGSRSPYLLVAILFLMTTLLSQIISSSAAALITIPIATAAATEIGISPRTALVSVAVGAAAAFLMPISSTVNLMVLGPGGYRFGDYWKLGLLLMLWFFAVTTVLVPLMWPF